ncbi:MAG: hypothetical protein RIS92_3185 [Verrucomicrobiota bacterium]|jgi:outer membrane protein assembly factor BamB
MAPDSFFRCVATLGILSFLAGQGFANWPKWRGPEDLGSTGTGTYPVRWSGTENLRWKVELPGKGCSTPIVWEQRIYVTTAAGDQDAAMAFDWEGRELWRRELGAQVPGKHRNGSGSNPSPTTDGTALFVQFKSGTLAALELDGRVRWKTNLVERYGKDTLYWDYGCSPVLTRKDVVVAMMHRGESWLAAFDKVTGELSWKIPRNYQTPVENDHSYATPLVIQEGGREALLVWGGEHLTAHDAKDGSEIWSVGDFNPEKKPNWVVVGSPVLVGDMAVVPYGRGARLHGVRLGGKGDVTGTHRAWARTDTGTFVPTPAAFGGRVYLGRDRGEVECIDPRNGETVWSGAFPKSKASYYSSPTIADGKLYFPREDGVIFVASIAGKFELLSENDMGEQIIAAPVPVAGRLLLRGEKHLFCVGP